VKDIQEAAGIAEFFGASGLAITISGLLIQCGTSTSAVQFPRPYPQRCDNIQITPIGPAEGSISVASYTPEGFTVSTEGAAKSFFWLAIGT
jgi:hypothetical protein